MQVDYPGVGMIYIVYGVDPPFTERDVRRASSPEWEAIGES